ncbi:DNA alkylation repair protein [Wenyingzhuangia sp. IMCC45533]
MEPLKNVYNSAFFDTFLTYLDKVVTDLDKSQFKKDIFFEEWKYYELKDRMHHIAKTLHTYLDTNFKEAVKQIKNLVKILLQNKIKGGFEYLFLPDYVEIYGIDYLEDSVTSFETITTFVSCEFAIRPFIKLNEQYVMAKMNAWSFDANLHLRRLASEGCRPRLPWAMALPVFKDNPSPILPILKNLLNDPELYVRKSVANNLNDISKDHPNILIALTEKHYGETEHTNWILKHANRNLLKQAEPRIMEIFGFGNNKQLDVQNFKISTRHIQLGDELFFSFNLINNSDTESLVRLEYAIYYLKQNGSLSKKIFQISQKEYTRHSVTPVTKKQHFKPISTRKYHFGMHQIAIIANGKEFEALDFSLTS